MTKTKTRRCRHRFGSVQKSWITGNPHRRCLDCGLITLDLTDEPAEDDQTMFTIAPEGAEDDNAGRGDQ